MTDREKEILDLIKKNPMIQQKEIASELGITRSSVAVHITNLLKKGLLKGKGYIVSENDYVVLIGAANLDIQGFTRNKLIERDSNPGKIQICTGGVSRNIAENLAKLQVDTQLISAIGLGANGKRIIDECRQLGISTENSLILPDVDSSIYMAIMDQEGDMALALSDMTISDRITVDFIRSKTGILEKAAAIIMDTCIPKDVLAYVITNFRGKPLFIETVSVGKAQKLKDIIGGIHTLKTNRLEAEYLSGIKIEKTTDLQRLAEYFIKHGVGRVFITLGKDGVCYQDQNGFIHYQGPQLKVKNATGAGDAFTAGLVYSNLNNYTIDQTLKFSTAASILALSGHETVNPLMCIENIEKILKELS